MGINFVFLFQVSAVTTDNASSNKKMIDVMAKKLKRDNKNFTAKRHIPCFAHILNLVVQSAIKRFDIPSASQLMAEEGDEQLTASDYASDMDVEEDVDVGPSTSTSMHRVPVTLGEAVAKVRTLVRATRNGSQRRLMYAKLCADLNMSNNNLLELDCPTRWNSTYDMLRAAIEKRAVLDEGTSHFKTNGRETKISKDEWELLRIFTDLLEPFSFATQHVCQTVTPTITDVLFILQV